MNNLAKAFRWIGYLIKLAYSFVPDDTIVEVTISRTGVGFEAILNEPIEFITISGVVSV